jgi:hypothetical protein
MRCESKQDTTGEACPARAPRIVAAGCRKPDEQVACATHLNRVRGAMEHAEGRPGTRLTVRRAIDCL